MPGLKPNEEKALAWYCQMNGLVPQLSTYPTMYFLNRSGEEHKREMWQIVLEWEAWRKEEKRNKGA